MFGYNVSSMVAVIGTIDPVVVTTTELFTDVLDFSRWDQVMAIAMTGDMAASTLDFSAYSCVAAGTSAVLIKGTTQLASSATANDLSQLIITLRASEVGALTGNKQYGKFGLVSSGSGGPCAVVVLGFQNRYGTAQVNDLASVLQIKTA